MKKISRLIIYLTLISCTAYCQKIDSKKLEQTIAKAIDRSYSASVRIWGFDTVSKQQMSGQFSGVVVSKEGHILTAAHVTIPGKTYKVMFPDGRECIAVGLGKIEFTADRTIPDVAMMKIISNGIWPFAQMGKSSTLKEYEPCISIAYPESLYQPKPTVRFGWISQIKTPKGFVQSTCIMEPGDSGGPLFDYLGNVIALHSAIEIPENCNYEVPIDLYIKYWTALNIPKVYTSLPGTSELAKVSLPDINDLSLPGLKNLNNALSGEKLKNACLAIISQINGKDQRVEGTLFSSQGLRLKNDKNQSIIVSKSSLIGNEPFVVSANNRKVRAVVIARDKENDLVLLQPMVEIKGGIKLSKLHNAPLVVGPGIFLVSAQPDTTDIISITGSAIFSLPKISSGGFLGAAIAYKIGPLLITRMQPRSPASDGGLEIGDEVLNINNVQMNKADDYGRVLQNYWPGDTIAMDIKRAGINYKKRVILGVMPQIKIDHPAELFAGGKSIRRDGFEKVFSHDAILTPDRCGGPVFDLYGQFYGINIARHSRASSLVIPVTTIYEFIDNTLKKQI
jgi:serine protease Do